jgi:hypothetical protein
MSSVFSSVAAAISQSDGPTKSELIGSRVVVELLEYDPARPTAYGSSPCAFVRLVVLDGQHRGAVVDRYLFAGNIGRQIGEGLEVGGLAPAEVVSGKTKTGGSWFGVEWLTDEASLADAESSYLAIVNGDRPTATASPAASGLI